MEILAFAVSRESITKAQTIHKSTSLFDNASSSLYKSGYISDYGWGNGYVAIPPNHPWHGMPYESFPVEVHGGLTYAREAKEFKDLPTNIPEDYWLIGFDTAHSDDNIKEQDELFVVLETEHLKRQLEALSKEILVPAALFATCSHCLTLNTLDIPKYDYEPFHGSFTCSQCKKTNYYSTQV